MVSVALARGNARRPAASSYKTSPNENWSDCAVRSALPRACSGLMYAMVPSVAPASVRVMARVASSSGLPAVTIFARPKSRILTRPSRAIRMLSGFRSR